MNIQIHRFFVVDRDIATQSSLVPLAYSSVIDIRLILQEMKEMAVFKAEGLTVT